MEIEMANTQTATRGEREGAAEAKIGLAPDARRRVAEALVAVLADSYVLLARTHGCHWNVEGPQFPGLHELFEKQYQGLFAAIDEIAERIRSLDLYAPSSLGDMAANSRLDVDASADDASGMLRLLIADNEALARACREVAALCGDAEDTATEDLMNARIAAHDANAWMLRASLPR